MRRMPVMQAPAIRTEVLTRTYRLPKKRKGTSPTEQPSEFTALDGLSLEVPEGELFGLLGPNGAGKTTTIKILTTLLIPTSGTGMVLGFDVVREAKHIRKRIGFVFGGERGLYYRLSGADNLRY